jgi:hypothetical protein
LHRYAPFLLFSLAGFLFSNPVYADPPPLEALAGETKTVDSGIFPLTSTPFSGVLSANGGTITTAPPGLTLDAPTLQGADVRNGGTITITDSTFNVLDGLRVGTGGGTINATNLTLQRQNAMRGIEEGCPLLASGNSPAARQREYGLALVRARLEETAARQK